MRFSLFGRVKPFVRHLIERTYRSEQIYQQRLLRQQHRRNHGLSVLVHQMAKVGSQSVTTTLARALPDDVVYATHFLSERGLTWTEVFVKEHWPRFTPRWLWHGQFIRKNFLSGKLNRRLKIVTLVRDPVARCISEFFQELKAHIRYPYAERLAAVGLDRVADELERGLLAKLNGESDWSINEVDVCRTGSGSGTYTGMSEPYRWFDEEIREVFGIDLFAEDFDRSLAYAIYRGPHADLLVLKTERLSESVATAFSEFLGLSEFELLSQNVATKKYYSDAYRKILDRLTVPGDQLRKWYSSPHVTQFYDDMEIEGFIRRWSHVAPVQDR